MKCIITSPKKTHIIDFKAELNANFEMSNLGLLHHYLQIKVMHCDGGITLCYKKVYRNIVVAFWL